MNDELLVALKRAVQCRELGEYVKAQSFLDKLIEAEPECYLLWYEKSKLPIVQEDSFTIKNRSLSLATYQHLPLPDKSSYLQQCGFDIVELPGVEDCLRIPHLIEKQRMKYLQMAINYAPENEKAILTAELKTITETAAEKRRKDAAPVIWVGAIALIVAFSTVLLINTFFSSPLMQMPMSLAIVLLVPYALSVTGMVLYTRAKSTGGTTIAGLVSNLIALVVSNLSIINTIILFIEK